MITAWETLDDPQVLGEALDGISTLAELLERERAAVAVLDSAQLNELAEKKGPLVERLRALASATAPVRSVSAGAPMLSSQHNGLREHVRGAAVRLLAQAEANAALLNDAVHALSAVLGGEQETGTYDARARLGRRVRAFGARRV